MGNYDHCAGEQTSGTDSGDGAADDEGDGRWGDSANQGPQLEYGEAGQKHPFDAEDCVEFPEEELECCFGIVSGQASGLWASSTGAYCGRTTYHRSSRGRPQRTIRRR